MKAATLSIHESGRRRHLELVIADGLKKFIEVGTALAEIRDARLYRDEYGTFEDYCRDRWKFTRQRAAQLIDAAGIASDPEFCQPGVDKPGGHASTLCQPGVDKPASEKQVRPLKSLPPSERGDAWREAVAESEGQPTARKVEEVVNRRLGKPAPGPKGGDGASDAPGRRPPEADAEPFVPPLDPPAHANGKSIVNGVHAPDPPHVAAKRAAGIIPAGAVVEVVEPEPEGDAPDGEPDDAGMSDAEWLATLPVREHLSATRIAGFDADALEYRKVEPHRRKFRHHARRALAKHSRGAYAHQVRRFLLIDHPKHWLVCPKFEDGGCEGTGEIPMAGACPKCRGRGYYIR